ncbi:hypothetical protein B0I37DRAFT_419952 [Chaetomium sp. MPI-CAGE-AT-0009]|nr:hypothetical protein B0I37DRAFT_419952 [Chaetomium sp. MPI-CAGE-AT-0009]
MAGIASAENQAPALRNRDPVPQIFYDTASSRRLHPEPEDGRAIRKFLDASSGGGGLLDSIFVQSKFAAPPGHVEPLLYKMSDDMTVRVLKSVLRSAGDLEPTCLTPTFCIRLSTYTTDRTVQAWRVIEQLVSRGAIRYLGIANVALPRLYQAATAYNRDVVMFCRDHYITY